MNFYARRSVMAADWFAAEMLSVQLLNLRFTCNCLGHGLIMLCRSASLSHTKSALCLMSACSAVLPTNTA